MVNKNKIKRTMKQVIHYSGLFLLLLFFSSCDGVLGDAPVIPGAFEFRGDPDDIFMTPCEDSGDSEHISPGSLPAPALDFLARNYPDATIIKAERYGSGERAFYEVKLSNGKELYFNPDGSLLARDERLNAGDLPQSIRDYLAQNHAGVGVAEAERHASGNGTVYEIKLTDRTKLYFNEDGTLLARRGDDDDDDYHHDSWSQDHPAFRDALDLALDYIRTNFPGLEDSIEKVELEVEHGRFFLKVEFHHDRKMIFDTEGHLLCSYSDDDDRGGDDD